MALPATDTYTTHKAVWEKAGFSHFSEPAAPGDTVAPKESGFAYTLLDDLTLAVSWEGDADPEADLVIPATAELNGIAYAVSTIAQGGFTGRSSIQNLTIPASVTSIGDSAFESCTNLSQVSLSDGLVSIGVNAFAGTALQTVVLPKSLTNLGGGGSFSQCVALKRVVALTNNIDVAADTIAGCSGVSIYVPYDEGGSYPWNVGLAASGNHILPYGVSLPSDPCLTFVDQEASLLESNEDLPAGYIEAPEGVEVNYSYAASTIYVDTAKSTVKGKAEGNSQITVTLTLDGVELARAIRSVEVMHGVMPLDSIDWDGNLTFDFDAAGGLPCPDSQTFGTYITFYSNNIAELYDAPKEPSIKPSKTGYAFEGWYIESKPTELFDFNTSHRKVDESELVYKDGSYHLTLHAKWTLNQRIVKFNSNTGTGSMDPQTFTSASQKLSPNKFTKTGYVFAGWNTDPGGKGTPYNADTSYTLASFVSDPTVLYAQWAPATNTKYQVRHWTQKLGADASVHNETNYKLESTDNLTGTTGTSVTPATTTFTGFKPPSAQTKTITADGLLVIDYYYTRNSYAFTLGTALGVNTEGSTQSGTYQYGTLITLKATPLAGYSFGKWTSNNSSAAAPAGAQGSFNMPAGEVTMTPSASPITYTIHFNGSGFTGGSMSDLSMTYGVSKNLTPNGFERTGHRFLGWATAQGSSDVAYTDGQSVSNLLPYSGTVQLWAVWDANTYDVTFNSHGGTPVNGLSVKYGQTFAKPTPNPSKTGYAFDNWYMEETYSTLWNFNTDTMPAGTLELHAKWDANTYEVVFEANNGTGVMQNQVFTYDKSAKLLKSTMNRTGYTFAGWNTEANGSGTPYSDEQSVMNLAESGLVRLFAQWAPITYSITFNANGGEGSMSPIDKTYDASIALPSNAFSRIGYSFAGWAKSASGPVEFANGDSLDVDLATEAGKSVELFAKWTANTDTTYAVKHWTQKLRKPAEPAGEANYELHSTNNLTGTTDADVSPDRMSITGFKMPDAQTATITGDGRLVVNYYYTRNAYTLTFDPRNDAGVETKSVEFDATTTAPTQPTKLGYDFGGWYTEVNGGGTKWEFETSKMPALNTTLYAKWTPTSYSITYELNGGTKAENAPGSYTVEQAVAIPAASRTGYRFAGWYENEDLTGDAVTEIPLGSTGDKTFYARWILMINLDIPDMATLEVDATGDVTPVKAQLKSFMPEEVKLTAITADQSDSATKIMEQSWLDKSAVLITPDAGAPTTLTWNTPTPLNGEPRLAAAVNESTPSVWDFTIDLSVPDGVEYLFQQDEVTAELAKLSYQVEPVS